MGFKNKRPPYKNAKCAYWNINDHKSQIIGDKLEQLDDFLNVAKRVFLDLSELQAKTCAPVMLV